MVYYSNPMILSIRISFKLGWTRLKGLICIKIESEFMSRCFHRIILLWIQLNELPSECTNVFYIDKILMTLKFNSNYFAGSINSSKRITNRSRVRVEVNAVVKLYLQIWGLIVNHGLYLNIYTKPQTIFHCRLMILRM